MKAIDVSSPVTTEYFVARLRRRKLLEGLTFANFIVGDANKTAHAATVKVARHPGSACNPLFIYGTNGDGTTHLMCAIGHRLASEMPDSLVQYVHAEDFHADVVHAYETNSFERFLNAYRSRGVLLLDDIGFFRRKRLTQEALCLLLDELPEAGKQIVLTYGDLPENFINFAFEPSLARRIKAVMAVEIEPSDYKLRAAILHHKALNQGVILPGDVADFIAESVPSGSIRESEGALCKMLAYARYYNRAIDLELAREALGPLIEKITMRSSPEIDGSSNETQAPPVRPISGNPEYRCQEEATEEEPSDAIPASYTFSNWIWGNGNCPAVFAARKVADSFEGNPLIICAASGLGKTHLLHAIVNRLSEVRPKLAIRYMHAEDYYEDVVRVCQQESLDSCSNNYRNLDVLLLDDVEFLKYEGYPREVLISTLGAMLNNGKRIVITCCTDPRHIAGLDDRIRSILAGGRVEHIKPPDLELRVKILEEKARADGVRLDIRVVDFIAGGELSNVRELEGAWRKVLAYARFHARKIELQLAREALVGDAERWSRPVAADRG